MKTRDLIPVLANFDFCTGVPANLRDDIIVFLVTGNGRAVVKFPPSDWKKMRLDPNLDNSFVAVLPGNKMAVISKEEVKKQLPNIKNTAGQEYVFRMNVQEQAVSSVEEMKSRMAAL